jgi:hypothetical protein
MQGFIRQGKKIAAVTPLDKKNGPPLRAYTGR